MAGMLLELRNRRLGRGFRVYAWWKCVWLRLRCVSKIDVLRLVGICCWCCERIEEVGEGAGRGSF